MENSSLGPTQIPRRLANSDRSLENQRRQRSRVFEGVQQCGNPRAFAKPRGVSASETESHSPLLPLGRIVISRAEKTTRVFHRRFVPRSGWTHSPLPRNCDRSKTNGAPLLAFISPLLRSISHVQNWSRFRRSQSGASTPRASNLSRSIWITRCGAQREGCERGFACKFKRCSSKYNCLVFVREEEKLDVLEARED